MTQPDRPVMLAASVTWQNEQVILSMMAEDRVNIEFVLDPMALGLLALTAQPVMRLALDDLKQKHPTVFNTAEVPDSPEDIY